MVQSTGERYAACVGGVRVNSAVTRHTSRRALAHGGGLRVQGFYFFVVTAGNTYQTPCFLHFFIRSPGRRPREMPLKTPYIHIRHMSTSFQVISFMITFNQQLIIFFL